MEMEDLKQIPDSKELLSVYTKKLNIFAHEHGFTSDATKAEAILERKFMKTSQRFQTESEGRQILRKAIVNLCDKTWKRSTRELISEFRSKECKHQQPSTSGATENLTSEAKEVTEKDEAKQEKIKRHIRKLEKMLYQIQKKIDELELDSDWSDDDEENSPYILKDKYERKAVKIHKKIQLLRHESDKVGRSQEEPLGLPEESEFVGLARKIQKYVNKSQDLPDIQDYRELIEKYNDANGKKITPKQMSALSEKYIRIVTEKWRKRRLKDFAEDLLHTDQTPIQHDPELEKRLSNNDKDRKSIDTVLQEFTVKQEQVDTGQLEVETVNENDEPEDDIQADEELDEEQIANEFEIDAIESEYEDDHGDEDDSGEDRGQESNPEEDVKEILETKSNSQTTKEHSEPKETQNLTKSDSDNSEKENNSASVQNIVIKRPVQLSSDDDDGTCGTKRSKLFESTLGRGLHQPTIKNFIQRKRSLMQPKSSPKKDETKPVVTSDNDVICISD